MRTAFQLATSGSGQPLPKWRALEGADLWLLSPPCQPFTRTGKKMDVKDSRNAALLRLLDALPSLAAPPRALLLENVPEFVGSQMHGRLQQALQQCSFTEVEELVLDPRDFGFPNTRRRFYCLALQGSCSSKIG